MNIDVQARNPSSSSDQPVAELAHHYTLTYRSERRRIAGILRRLGVPAADVEDAVQDVFLALHARFHLLERGAALPKWLVAVAVRVSSNRRRSLRRAARYRSDVELKVDDIVDVRQVAPDDWSSDNERRLLLARALERLDSNKRQVFVLAEFEEHSMEEIAKLTSSSRNTVASRLRVARQRVASTIQGHERRLQLERPGPPKLLTRRDQVQNPDRRKSY
jgi:RNA polymerase sigma-70 factor (ECF subfamily)